MDAAFLQLRAGNSATALQLLCDADPVFADNIVIFGLAVFMRRYVENIRDNHELDPLLNSLCFRGSWRNRINQRVINEVFGDINYLNLHWNVLSVIIHAWDGRPVGADRFANFTTKDRYLPIFRWEVLTLFFYMIAIRQNAHYPRQNAPFLPDITLHPPGRAGPNIPILKSLQTIDTILDRLNRLVISTND